MRLTDIAICNLKVRRIRMAFLLAGLTIGIATIVALFSITAAMREEVRNKFAEEGERLVVAPHSERLSLSYAGVIVASAVSYEVPSLSADTLSVIQSIPAAGTIRHVAPKLLAVTVIGGRQYLVVGVDFSKERELNRHWQVQGAWPKEKDEVLLGTTAARQLMLSPGNAVKVKGVTFRVAGVLAETGGYEDRLIFMDLPTTQALFNRQGEISFVELAVARDPEEASERETAAGRVVTELRERLPGAQVALVKHQAEARKEVADRFAQFSYLIATVVFAVGCLMMGSTMMSSVNERTMEIGIFRAIGFRQRHIMQIILTEAALLSLGAGATGYLAGMAAARLATPLKVPWNPFLGAAVIFLAVLVGVLASLYPAVRAARLDPVEALRSL